MLAAWHPLTKAFLFLWFIRPVLLSLSGSIDIILIVLQLESDLLKVNSLMKVGIDPRKFRAHEKIWTYCMRKNQNFFFFWIHKNQNYAIQIASSSRHAKHVIIVKISAINFFFLFLFVGYKFYFIRMKRKYSIFQTKPNQALVVFKTSFKPFPEWVCYSHFTAGLYENF